MTLNYYSSTIQVWLWGLDVILSSLQYATLTWQNHNEHQSLFSSCSNVCHHNLMSTKICALIWVLCQVNNKINESPLARHFTHREQKKLFVA